MKCGFGMFRFKLFAIAALFGFSVIVMALWNRLVPDIFGWHRVNYWQALGLLVLCRILFGGFRAGWGGGPGMFWRQRMSERVARMTPEEREKFFSGMKRGRGWCGHHDEPEEKPSETQPPAS